MDNLLLEAVLKISAILNSEKKECENKGRRPVFRRTAKNAPLIFALQKSGFRIFKTVS